MAFVRSTKLRELTAYRENCLVVGIVIGKNDSKVFRSQSSNNQERAVLTLTIRDSEQDFVNCVCWGAVELIRNYDSFIHIGDVVDVLTPRITAISGTSSERYNPETSVPFLLTVNEGRSKIAKHQGSVEGFQKLLHIPPKSAGVALQLADIQAYNGSPKSCTLVDVLCLVRTVKPVKQLTSSPGGAMRKCRDVIVMDRSLSGLMVTIWNGNLIERSDGWRPLQTVLYLADLKVQYSDFHKCVCASSGSKTLVTESPHGPDMNRLLAYAAQMDLKDFDDIDFSATPQSEIESIKAVMSIQQIKDRMAERQSGDGSFRALVYAVFTKFNLDGLSQIVSFKCTHCKRIVKPGTTGCSSEECAYRPPESTVPFFDLSVNITDHTGTLSKCRIACAYAEKLLEQSPRDFLMLTDDERGQLKWRFLLDRFAIKLIVQPKSACQMRVEVSIVDCGVASADEVAANIKLY